MYIRSSHLRSTHDLSSIGRVHRTHSKGSAQGLDSTPTSTFSKASGSTFIPELPSNPATSSFETSSFETSGFETSGFETSSFETSSFETSSFETVGQNGASLSRFFTGSAASVVSFGCSAGLELESFVVGGGGGSTRRSTWSRVLLFACPLAPTSALAGVAAGAPPAAFHPGSPTPLPTLKSEQHSRHRSTSHAQHDLCKFATAPPHWSQNSRHPLAAEASNASSCESLVAAHSASAAISLVSLSAVALSAGAHDATRSSCSSRRRDAGMASAIAGGCPTLGSRRHARHTHAPEHLGHLSRLAGLSVPARYQRG